MYRTEIHSSSMKTLFIKFAGLFLAVFSNSLFDDKAFGKIIICDSSSCDGSFESDIISGSNKSDFISAGNGSDIVYGYGGDDILVGGDVNDVLHGGSGNDNITGGIGIDRLYGGQGNDTLVSGTFADLIVGREGDDKIISSDDSTGQRNHDDGSQDIIFCGPGHDEVWFSMHTVIPQ